MIQWLQRLLDPLPPAYWPVPPTRPITPPSQRHFFTTTVTKVIKPSQITQVDIDHCMKFCIFGTKWTVRNREVSVRRGLTVVCSCYYQYSGTVNQVQPKPGKYGHQRSTPNCLYCLGVSTYKCYCTSVKRALTIYNRQEYIFILQALKADTSIGDDPNFSSLIFCRMNLSQHLC